MSPTLLVLLCVASVVYAAAGQGGASGYIAVMGLYGVAPEVMRPTALCLNILVTGLGTWRLWRAGLGDWRGLWPFLLGSVPCSALGGAVVLPASSYRLVVGVVLIGAGLRLWRDAGAPAGAEGASRHPSVALRAATGGGIGLVSGLTGIGGGIFLAPVLLILRWADARRTAALTAPFILVNSVAGLAGNWVSVESLPAALPAYAAVTLVGALVGSHLAIRFLSPAMLRRIMALVLLFGGAAVLLRA